MFFRSKNKTKLTDYIIRFVSQSRRVETYKCNYRILISHLERFEKHAGTVICIENFSQKIAEDFLHYLETKGHIGGCAEKRGGLMKSTIRTYFDKLNVVLKRAKHDGYKTADISGLEVQSEDSNAIYLTISELKKLNELKELSVKDKSVRDMFLVGCFTALRFSDYSKITKENIVGSNIVVKTRKTGEPVIIPIHPVIREILDRNNGDFPKLKSGRPFNLILKRICKKAKIDAEILYERTVGTEVVRKRMKKYELVSSHTARRSGATNMYLAKIPTARIMLLTGHKTEQAFFKYIRIGKEENAKILSEHAFFK